MMHRFCLLDPVTIHLRVDFHHVDSWYLQDDCGAWVLVSWAYQVVVRRVALVHCSADWRVLRGQVLAGDSEAYHREVKREEELRQEAAVHAFAVEFEANRVVAIWECFIILRGEVVLTFRYLRLSQHSVPTLLFVWRAQQQSTLVADGLVIKMAPVGWLMHLNALQFPSVIENME